jgi:uncharacterized membrane protein HdeD (DUF308 family)
MQEQLEGAAWALSLWGIFSIIFGVLVIAWPSITLAALLVVVGIYFLASGVLLFVGSLIRRAGHWILGAVMGAISAAAGLYIFAHPLISALALLSVVAVWAIVLGTLEIVAGFESIANDWWLILSGLVLLLFGFYIFAKPGEGALVLAWLIGISAIVSGIMAAVSGVRLGAWANRLAPKP